MEKNELQHRIKELLVEELMLDQQPEEIGDEEAFFGPDGLGLDSVDALQLSVATEKEFGVKLAESEVVRQAMQNVTTLAEHILTQKKWK